MNENFVIPNVINLASDEDLSSLPTEKSSKGIKCRRWFNPELSIFTPGRKYFICRNGHIIAICRVVEFRMMISGTYVYMDSFVNIPDDYKEALDDVMNEMNPNNDVTTAYQHMPNIPGMMGR